MEKILKTTMKPYKEAMKKWVKDTGAGSGEEVLFVTWDKTISWRQATDTRFQNFDKVKGEWSTWVYLLDKQFDNILWPKYGTMRGIAAKGDTGSSGLTAVGSDFNAPSASGSDIMKLVKANMENGKNAMDRIAEALESGISGKSLKEPVQGRVPGNLSNESSSLVNRLTLLVPTPRNLDQVVKEKMAAINSLKRDKEDAEKNETDENIKQMRIDTMWTLYREINSASDSVNAK